MNSITFTSVLGRRHRQELEKLLFFNPGQHRVRAAILEAIEKYGIPKVVEEQGWLRVRLDSGREVQTLFAMSLAGLSPKLAGVMVYTRLEVETILLLHMAVARDYASRGRFGREMLAPPPGGEAARDRPASQKRAGRSPDSRRRQGMGYCRLAWPPSGRWREDQGPQPRLRSSSFGL
jgi:hypothetical protein